MHFFGYSQKITGKLQEDKFRAQHISQVCKTCEDDLKPALLETVTEEVKIEPPDTEEIKTIVCCCCGVECGHSLNTRTKYPSGSADTK